MWCRLLPCCFRRAPRKEPTLGIELSAEHQADWQFWLNFWRGRAGGNASGDGELPVGHRVPQGTRRDIKVQGIARSIPAARCWIIIADLVMTLGVLAAGSSLPSRFAIATGWCSPALPTNVYERSKPSGPSTFISQLSFARDPRIDTRHSPGLSLSTCSMRAAISPRVWGSPVFCISTWPPYLQYCTTPPCNRFTCTTSSKSP
jgi:hypothetical protein